MTSEELKDSLPMRQVIESYGVTVRRDGMCCCPIHGERHPSMKIYKDSFNCFACGANGDIFTFVQLMDNCDFKTAFYNLGGTYKKTTEKEKKIAYLKRDIEKNTKQKEADQKRQFKQMMIDTFDLIKKSLKEDEPFSERWCASLNMLPILGEWWDTNEAGEEINVIDVYRKCQQFNQRFDSIAGCNS